MKAAPSLVRRLCLVAGLAAGLAASPAHAQFSDFIKRNLPLGAGLPSTTGDAEAAPAASDEAVAKALPVAPPSDYKSEMAPDLRCDRPREKFDVSEKLANYGGLAAQLRFQRLIATDYKYSDLAPEDKQMLQYVAQTTVWIPVEIESKFGWAYDSVSGFMNLGGGSLNESQELALEDIRAKLTRMRSAVADYPAEIHLKVDKKLQDGAFARFGGLVVISERFLNGLGDAETGADFLLSHEVSHVYKRHAVKNIQFSLISSAEGWSLARKLLVRAQRGLRTEAVGDTVFAFTTVPKLIEFVKTVQVRFNKEQELEADACSTVWLKALNVDPVVAWEQYLAKLGANTTYATEHPTTEDRDARLRTKASGTNSGPAEKTADKGTVKTEGKKIIADSKKQPAKP